MTEPIFFHVDAFTAEPFRGNPAGIIILNNFPDDTHMQQMAADINLSETAFLVPSGKYYHIRYFTPEKEVDLCGHATLAASHVLWESGMLPHDMHILFNSKAGELTVKKNGDLIEMNFPVYDIEETDKFKDSCLSAGLQPERCYISGNDWKIALLKDEQSVSAYSPEREKLLDNDLGALLITAPSAGNKYDFVTRVFVPSAGLNEDPVTGSAQCVLTPLWHSITGKKSFKCLQLSARTGELFTSLDNDRVSISGQAVTIIKGNVMMKVF